MKSFESFWNAINYAFEKYGKKFRDDNKTPYIIHPIRICSILRAAGYNEFEHNDIMISALLHDLIEDTEVTKSDITRKFGNNVATIVDELTNDNTQDKEEYLESLENRSNETKIIKMADRIDNLLDIDNSNKDDQEKMEYADHGIIILEKCGNADNQLSMKLEEIIKKTIESVNHSQN